MKNLFWKIVLCVVPVLLAGLAVLDALGHLSNGITAVTGATVPAHLVVPAFKQGVDLRGGTILVYEIDTRKLDEKRKEEEKKTSGSQGESADVYYKRKAGDLASALKKRIDPTATYNIIIRPAGSEGRVEIILPTGGIEEAEKAEKAWQEVMAKMKTTWKVEELNVPRGQVDTVVDKIQKELSQKLWKSVLFKEQKSWDRLIEKIKKNWTQLEYPAARDYATLVGLSATPAAVTGSAFLDRRQVRFATTPRGDWDELTKFLTNDLPDETPAKIEAFMKEQAWHALIYQLTEWSEVRQALETQVAKDKFDNKKVSDLKADKASAEAFTKAVNREVEALREELLTVQIDSFNELVGRVATNGDVIAQAVMDAAEPLVGTDLNVPLLVSRDKIEQFVTEHYGPSEKSIRDTIKQDDDETGRSRDLTVEEVQRVKDLVAKVGALEFRILANGVDDKQGIKDAQDFINLASKNPLVKEELEKAAVNGLPPPGPRKPGTKDELQTYPIQLPHDYKSVVSYSWVEIGKQERKALGFNNSAQTAADQRLRSIWLKVAEKHDQALQITDPNKERYQLWQGALFYRRDCKDRNLPEKERRAKRYEYFVLTRNPEIDENTKEPTSAITGAYLSKAEVDTNTGRPQVSFTFDSKGATLFGTLTRKNVPTDTGGSAEEKIKRHLSIILDGLVMSAPTINSEISYRGVITGDFTRREVESLVNVLQSGALPATLKPEPVSESTMGATLGEDTRVAGVWAVIVAFIGVVIFMVFYYRFAGVVACVALFANLLLTIGFMASVQATFTLAGLAGLVLMLGMAVDANVLIYERLREERDRGASLALALRNGYERALPTIIDTHLTSIFTAIVLYAVGNDQLKGFGITLTVGLIISLFTSLFMTRVMFDFWLSNGWLRKLSMMRLLSHPNVNFMRIRKPVFIGTAMFSIFGLALFLSRVPYDLDIDFKGGTALTAQLVKAKDIEELRNLVGDTRQEERLQVQSVEPTTRKGSEEREYKITYKRLPGQENKDFTYTVILANPPAGKTEDEQKEDLAKRVSHLPDWSVEQLYTSMDTAGIKDEEQKTYATKLFTIRTSEMEREIVQTILDRLLQDKEDDRWTSLLLQNRMLPLDKMDEADQKLVATLSFERPAYPSYVKMLLHRQLRQHFDMDASTGRLKIRYELIGLGAATEGGKYKQMQVTFTPDLEEQKTKDMTPRVKLAVQETRDSFNQRPQPERLENFDSELAADTRLRAVGAIFASWLAVILYLWFRFGNWTFGLAAVLCLIHDLCFTLGLVAIAYYVQAYLPQVASVLGLIDFKIDLNGVAALLTLVGYSVADTIVVFDRIREVRGKNPELTPQIINDSINQTLSRTILTSFTTFIVVLILYIWGGPGVHLFAYIMTIGVIVGTLSSIFVASPLLLILGEGRHRETVRERRTHATTGSV